MNLSCFTTLIDWYSLSLLEVLLERVGEPLGVLDELPLPLLERLLALGGGDEGAHLVHRVQQLLDRAGDLPEKKNTKIAIFRKMPHHRLKNKSQRPACKIEIFGVIEQIATGSKIKVLCNLNAALLG